MAPKDDLERDIREMYALIREHEEIVRDSDRPTERRRARREIKRLRTLIGGKLEEYRSLCERLDVPLDDEIVQIAALLERRPTAPPPPVVEPGPTYLTQAPPLPAHFVPRPEVSEALKARLLDDGRPSSGVLVVSAIHGLEGIGKSTLAAALAHDPDVQARFPDGVLWATLGQQPDLAELLLGWIYALGDRSFRLPLIESASAHLRSLLHDRACLLVVDDAWEPAHVRPFLVGGPRCRVLITTREAVIANAVGATLYALEVMTPEQALALLIKKLDRSLAEGEREQALALAEAVGYLPLALELAAAQVNDGVPWADLLADLQAEIARPEALELPEAEGETDETIRKRLSLLASFNLSLRQLPEARREQFARLGVLPEDISLTPTMMATVWWKEEREARDGLRYLYHKALLLPGAPLSDGTPTYRLHNLLHGLARRLLVAPPPEGLGLTLREAHAQLVARYCARTRGGRWSTLPDDGYGHAYLSWHMAKAGEFEALGRLIEDRGWYAAQRARDPSRRAYARDVERALEVAEGRGVAGVPAVVGWSLLYGTLGTLATQVPVGAMEVMARLGEGEQALRYAELITDPKRQAEAYRRIGLAAWERTGRRTDQVMKEALDRALAAAERIRDTDDRAQALTAVAQALAQGEEFDRALAAAKRIEDDWRRVQALIAVAQALAQGGARERARQALDRALAAAKRIESNRYGAQALTAVAQAMTQVGEQEQARQALDRALAAAERIEKDWRRAQALTAVAQALAQVGDKDQARQALARALVTTERIRWSSGRAQALTAVAQALAQGGAFDRALAAAERIESNRYRAQVLTAVTQALDQETLVAIAQALAQVGDKDQARQALARALAAAERIEDAERRAQVLTTVAQAMAQVGDREGLSRVLAAAERIEDIYWHAQALTAVAQALAQVRDRQGLTHALAAAERIESDRHRAQVLTAVAQALAQVAAPGEEQAAGWLITAFRAARARGREEVWRYIRAFVPLLARLGCLPATWERLQAVERVFSP